MAGSHITITVDNAQALNRLNRLGELDTVDLMPRLGEYLKASTKNRFETQKKPDGTPWEELKPAYARRKKYNKDKILTLRGYLSGLNPGLGPSWQPDGKNSIKVGVAAPYGAIHQLGGTITQNAQSRRMRFRSVAGRTLFAGKRDERATERLVTLGAYQVRIPARPFLGLSTTDRGEVKNIVLDWISERS